MLYGRWNHDPSSTHIRFKCLWIYPVIIFPNSETRIEVHMVSSWLNPYDSPWLLGMKSQEKDHEIVLSSTKIKNQKQFCIPSKRVQISAKIVGGSHHIPLFFLFINLASTKNWDEFGRSWGTTINLTGWSLNLSYWDKCSIFMWIDQYNLLYLVYSQKLPNALFSIL